MDATFYVAAVVAILATIMMITRLNAVHALLYLIVSLLRWRWFSTRSVRPFIAALEVIIYAGAIMVLFVFVVMMLNLGRKNDRDGARLVASLDVDRAMHPRRHLDCRSDIPAVASWICPTRRHLG